MKEIVQNIVKSFNNKTEGFASKKLTAFAVMACVVAAHVKWIALGDFSQLVTVLGVDFTFILTLYGVNVYDKKVNPSPPIPEEKAN